MGFEEFQGATEGSMTDEALFWEAAAAIQAAKAMPVGTNSMELNLSAVGHMLDERIREIEQTGEPFYEGTSEDWKPITPEGKEVLVALRYMVLDLDTAHLDIAGHRRNGCSAGGPVAVRGSGIFRRGFVY